MEEFPWDDDAISGSAHKATSDLPRSLTACELRALGLPVDDPFWMSPEAFDAHLAEVEGQQAGQAKTLGPDAPAAQSIRVACPSRAPLPSLDPRRTGPSVTELPEAVRSAVVVIATPHAPNDQAIGAAAYLLKWYQTEYHRRPTLEDIVLWWWQAARRLVDVRKDWANEMKVLWKTDTRLGAPDPTRASANAFFGHLAYCAAGIFIKAMGHSPDDATGRQLLRSVGFSPAFNKGGRRKKRAGTIAKNVR